jgi:Mrp family chromosome partitioning ATPase/uncharacterized protein involved in exopolysaccharide biosynthesis
MNETSLVPIESNSLRPGYAPYPEPIHDGDQAHPLKMIHSFFRGRYWLLFLLAAILTPLGVWGGFKLGITEYQSEGEMRILPVLPKVLKETETNGEIPMFDQFLDAEAATMRSQRVIENALSDAAAWKDWKWPLPDNFDYKISQELVVTHQGEIISLTVTDQDPVAAQKAVQTIMKAYSDIYQETHVKEDQLRNDLLDQQQTSAQSDVAGYRQAIHDLVVQNSFGTDDLTQFYNDKLRECETIAQALQMAKLGRIQNAGAVVPIGGDPDTQLFAIANQGDKLMEQALAQRQQFTMELQEMQSGASPLGDKNPQVVLARQLLDNANQTIKQRKAIYDKAHGLNEAATTLAGSAAPTTQPNADQVAALQQELDQGNSDLQKLGQEKYQLEDLKYKLAKAQAALDTITERINSLSVESTMSITGRLQPMNNGTRPIEPSRDTHIAMSVLGGFTGISMSVFMVVLLTLRNRRFHSPEDTGFSALRCPMLGILPTLTNDLSDPEQAAMAAHFVHGIRAMLQIKGTTPAGRVIAITSPSAHNGKTSISLALGVSFAGAHSNTLLIDCDFIGRALSDRTKAVARPRLGRILRHQGLIDDAKLQEGLDHAVQHGQRLGEALVEIGYLPSEKLDAALVAQKDCTFGVLEAIDGEDLAECVAPTAIPGLSILPLGQASAEHIGSLSPSMLQQVLASCRKKYDIIIVDTGPILGSLEAAMVATQADDVVMILSNGENRASAERSLRYLESVGARVAGFVFNRATSRDFINSDGAQRMSRSSSSSTRWRHANGSVAAPGFNHFGPVAQAVARGMGEATVINSRSGQNGAGKNGAEKNGNDQNGGGNDHGRNGNGKSA